MNDSSNDEDSSMLSTGESKVRANGKSNGNGSLEVKAQPLGADYPSALNTLELAAIPFVVVQKDRCSARYSGRGHHVDDFGTVRGNKTIPPVQTVYYFEIKVEDPGFRGEITIGFSPTDFPLMKQCGAEPGSYGYCGQDGRKYGGERHGDVFGPFFNARDVVGCGYSAITKSIFFTKNGALIGTAFEGVSRHLLPTVSLHSPGEAISVNFGSHPFKFDCDALIELERSRVQEVIEQIPVPNELYYPLVATYLAHAGYVETLSAFQNAHGSSASVDLTLYPALKERSRIRKLIVQGKIDEAMLHINTLVPGFADRHPDTMCQIHCQKFLELVKQRKTTDAVLFARQTLSQYTSPESRARVLRVMGALAYTDLQSHPLLHGNDTVPQDEVADSVNSAILASLGHDSTELNESPLESIARQLKAVEGFLSL